MSALKDFSKLFLRRFFWPLDAVGKKFYQALPSFIQAKLTTGNLQFTALILLFVVLWMGYFWPRNKLAQKQLAVIRWPYSVNKNLDMANVLFETGNLDKAKLTIQKAQSLYQLYKPLDMGGSMNKQLQEGQSLISQPANIQQQINHWETILSGKPNFRDVYLKLSLLYHQLWQDNKAREYWEKAFYLDPNNSKVKEVGKLINQED
jgi:tetratricopeptide (TPR) repeat protein